MRPVVHIALHFIVPGLVAGLAFRARFWRAFGVMAATILVDLDHLLAEPMYDPNRCSLGYHPLHTWPAVLVYVGMIFVPRLRFLGLGLVIHMVLDGLDCWLM